MDTAQCSVIDSEPLTDLSHASNANAANAAAAAAAGGVWHPAKNVAAAMKVQTFYAFSTIFYSSFFYIVAFCIRIRLWDLMRVQGDSYGLRH